MVESELIKTRTCRECGCKVIGRQDKKFCCDQCRSHYHNRINRTSSKIIYRTDRILRRNRQILSSFRQKGLIQLTTSDLMRSGFNFAYFTNEEVCQTGEIRRFCYEQGYTRMNDECIIHLVVLES